MRSINIILEEGEFQEVDIAKGDMTWREFIVAAARGELK